MIDVEIQDEFGIAEARFDAPAIVRTLVEKATAETKCLQFIDPYGNTTFNPRQTAVLVAEIGQIAENLPVRAREQARRLVAFIGPAADAIHTYVKFIGD